MSTRKDPGSYTVCDEPFDTYDATLVPLRTPRGPVTLHFTSGSHVRVATGYQVSGYSGGEANYSGGEGLTADNIEVCGDMFLYRHDADWTTEPYEGHIHNVSLYGRGGSVTPRREADVVAYWGEVVRRYAAEHPHVLAHADLRAAVAAMTSQEQDVAEAEEALREMRKTLAGTRRAVRQTLTAEYRTGGPDSPDQPRPYHNEPVNGYVVSLVNDRDFMVAAGTVRPRQETR